MSTYKHDCDKCKFVGEFAVKLGSKLQVMDGYVCGDSVLLRYGNEPHEYMSSPVEVILYAAVSEKKGALAQVVSWLMNDGKIKITIK